MNRQRIREVVVMAAMSGMLAGCGHKAVRKGAQAGAGSQVAASSPIETGAEPSVRGDALVAVPALKTVYFDYDSDRLRPEAGAILRANAQWLKEHAGARIQIAGNCDQRGTEEYNLALGQRRAAAVRTYYRHLGIAADRLATISYGKEKPVCTELTDACMQKNRRADHFQAVAQSVSAATGSSLKR